MTSSIRRIIAGAVFVVSCAAVSAFGARAAIVQNGSPVQPVIYAVTTDGKVLAYDANNGRRLGSLVLPKQRPVGNVQIAVDGSHTVYVGGTYGQKQILIQAYAPGSITPSRTLNGGTGYVNAIAAAASGELTSVRYSSSNLTSYLDFFAPGATSPTRTIKTPFDFVGTAAYAADGTLWIHGLDFKSKATFGFVAPGGTTVTLVNFVGAPSDGPIAIDGAGNVVTEFNGVLAAYSAAGTFMYKVKLGLRPGHIDGMTFSADHTLLYVADPFLQIEVYRLQKSSAPIAAFGTYSFGVAM